MASETLAEQVKSEGVDAGGGEAEDPGQQGDDHVSQRQVHLVVVEGTVHVEDVVGEPAQGKETHEHQDDLGQTLPGLDLEGRERRSGSGFGAPPEDVWGNGHTCTSATS